MCGICGGNAPDTSGMNAAAQQQAALSKEALDWYKQEYAKEAPQRQQAQLTQQHLAESEMVGMNQANADAADLSNRRRTVAQPLEDKIIADAQAYDTPERRAQARAAAAAGVESSFDRAGQEQQRQLARAGMSDSMSPAAMAALQQDQSLAKARTMSGATYNADQQVEQQGHARMVDAAGLTKGIVGNQATLQGVANSAGGAASSATTAGLAASTSGTPMMQAGFSSAMQGNQSSGNLYGQVAQIQAKENQGQLGSTMAGVGGIMQGLGAMGYSSKKLKMEKEPISDDEALAKTNRLSVESWKYKDGVADGGEHVGPYAEDVQREFGDDAAPNGDMVDMKAMAGHNGQAIAALAKQVEEAEAALKQLTTSKAKPAPKRQRARMEA